jgi:hypothetical protein
LPLAGCAPKDSAGERARLEEEFRNTMTGAVLAGRFSVDGSEGLREERYTVSSATKLAGGIWTLNTRIQYGNHDVTVPVPVNVLWAGDTPVISLTDATIPGLGAFTARVLVYRDRYAGTWSSSKGPGGQMSGRIERAPPQP